ncbi:diguanylate cyclase [Kineosporia sp. J2-2]|uniref:Diguanylate cyclase n=1 Tax=Kineosporia corallincola TaxID=2835133 RepID=A0ABS5TKS3_9ACTN|nr:diguanylate cyclase [Kineosporia corallincola]MBT0771709.1 diguanylate cyclase [Kineosporia corallincola]
MSPEQRGIPVAAPGVGPGTGPGGPAGPGGSPGPNGAGGASSAVGAVGTGGPGGGAVAGTVTHAGGGHGTASVGVPVELPGFEVLGQLGGGAGSTVYRVRRAGVDDEGEYALKLLDRAEGLTALRREAALLTAVDHPGLPRVHEVGVAERRPYLVMDLVRGTSLAEVLGRGALPPERVVALALDVIEPLAAVHARGLVHRDLKPQNIMVLPDGQARLIDFGLTAREGEDDEGESAPAVGTLAYSAPEQSGMLKRPVDDRSDLYSLGVILFEALAGVLPFPTTDVGELLRAHASLAPPDLLGLVPDTPPELAHVVATLLAKDPDDRYQDGHALAADLRAVVGKQTPPPRQEAPPMFGRRDEMATLHRQWTETLRGSGGFAFVRSDNGLGKTRLVNDFADRVEESGGTVLRARVLPGAPMPFAVFREVFVAYLHRIARLPWNERWERAQRLRAVFEGWSPAALNRIAPGLDAVIHREGDASRGTAFGQGPGGQGLSGQGLSGRGLSERASGGQGLSERGLSERASGGQGLSGQGLSGRGPAAQGLSGPGLSSHSRAVRDRTAGGQEVGDRTAQDRAAGPQDVRAPQAHDAAVGNRAEQGPEAIDRAADHRAIPNLMEQNPAAQNQAAQGQAAQSQMAQSQMAQGQAAQGQAAQGQTAQNPAAQGRTAQGRTAQGQMAQGQTAQGQAGQGQGGRDQQGQGHAAPGQTGPGQTGPGQTGPGQARPDQAGPGQAGPGQAGPGQTVTAAQATQADRAPRVTRDGTGAPGVHKPLGERGNRGNPGDLDYAENRGIAENLDTAADLDYAGTLGLADGPVGQLTDEQIGTAIATALLDLARASGGLLLILDDVTAADASVRQVIGQLAAEIRGVPLMYLGAGRDGELERVLTDSELTSYIAVASRVLDVDLRLTPLDEAASGEQIRSLVPGQQLPADALEALTTRSNGNPFVAQEYLWAVLDAGLLWPSWGTWQLDLDRLDALALPQDAMGLVLNRVQNLAPHARDLLVTGAAMGPEVRIDVVAAVERRSTANVLGVFAEAARQRLVEPGQEGTFRFLHGRIAEAMLAELPPGRLEDLHRRIADVLAARPPSGPAQVVAHTFAIARHYIRAGSSAPPERVLAACLDAGRLALDESAAEEAVTFLEQAARLVPRRSPRSGPVLVLLGRALKQAGRFSEARRRLEQALAAEQDPLAQAAIHTQLAEVYRAGYRSEELGEAIAQGFVAAVGKPLPRSTFWLVLSSALMALASIPLRRVQRVRGGATGERRRRALAMAGLHEAAIFGAGLGMRVPEFFAHNLRGLYWAAVLGHGRRFVAAQANFGVLCAAIGLNRAAERCFRRCDADPSAQSPQTRAMLRSFRLGGAWAGNRPEGEAWRRQFDDFSAWLDFTPLIDSVTTFNLTACFAGRTEEAQHWLAYGRTRLDGRAEETTTFVTAAPMTAALLGRPVEAETELTRLNQLADQGGARQLRFIRVMAGLFVLLEDGETGEPLDRLLDEFDALGVPPHLVWRAHRPVFHLAAAARLAQARALGRPGTPEALREQSRRLTQAHQAVELLGKAANTDEMKAFHAIARADLLVLQEQPRRALDVLAALDLAAGDDLPAVAFETARIAARALRTLNPAEGRRRARTAWTIAGTEGWPHRAASVVTEFSLPVEDRAATLTGTRHSTYSGGFSGGHEKERLQALQEVSAAASRVLDPRVLARIALDETIRILAADRAFLFLVDPETGTLSQHLGRDSAGQDLARLTGYSTSLVEMVRRSGEPQVVAGTEEGAALGAESVVLHGLRSILVAPMKLNDRLLGVVYLDSQVAKGIFTTGDTVILGALTSFVASALETARAAELAIKAQTAERSAELARALQRAQERMAEPVEPLGVLNQLLLAAGRDGGVLDAGTAFVLRPGRSGVGNRTGVLLTPGPKQPAITAFTDDGGSESLSGAGGPISGDAGDAPAVLRERLPDVSSWLALPLRATDVDLGVLVLACSDQQSRLADSVELGAALVAQGMTAYDRAALFERVQELAVVDELTQLANRRRFFEIATRDLEAAQRQERPLIAMMMDIDHFKRVNDTYGHPTGDDVIQEVARRLSEEVRTTDVIGRYGGEEFAVLQQGDDPDLELAERLRACVCDTPVPTRTGPLAVTISIGATWLHPDDEDVAGLLARADQGLYKAKEGGRNQVGVVE